MPDVELLTAGLHRGPLSIIELLRDRPLPEDTELLIVVDQFEELIRFRARIDTNEADAFVALLLATISEKELPVRVVITLRTDYLGECALFRGLPEILNGCQYLVPRLEREQLLDAIISPARVFDADVDSVLANHIVNEIGRSQDQLPVIEHALLWMWTRAKERAQLEAAVPDREVEGPLKLTMADYDDLGGGLGEALSKHADEVYQSLATDADREIARRLFCALWDEHAHESDTRRPCTVREAAAIAGVSVDHLCGVADAFRKTEHSLLMPPPEVLLQSETILDVGHESLFRHWNRLKEWCRAEANSAEQYRQWGSLARAWASGHGELISDRSLETADAWSQATKPNAAWARRYSNTETEFATLLRFLEASKRAQEDRRRAQRRVRQRVIGLSIAGVVVVFAMMLLAGFFLLRARATDRDARKQRLTLAAFNAVHSEPIQALQLAIEANRFGGPEAEVALRKALRASQFRKLIIASSGFFDDAKFLPDGKRLVTVGEGDGVAIWDLATGARLGSLRGAERHDQIVIDPRGEFAATAGPDGSVDVWDLRHARHAKSLAGHLGVVTDVAFSPDGSLLATASEDGTAAVWDMRTGGRIHELIRHLGAVRSVAFTHDGLRLATTGVDGRILFWDLTSGKKLKQLTDRDLDNLAFNSSGGLLAASSDSSVVLWDPITGRKTGELSHTNRVNALAFSPDGSRIATASFDGTVRIWDAATRSELLRFSEEPALFGPLPAPTVFSWPPTDRPVQRVIDPLSRFFRRVAFSADGRQLVTTSLDGTAKVWAVDGGGEINAFKAHDGAILRVAYDRFGGRLATGGMDGTAALWDAHGQLLFRTPKRGTIRGVSFNRTGSRLAIANEDTISVWDLGGQRVVKQMKPGARIGDLEMFHHDNRVVASAGTQLFIWQTDDSSAPITIDTKTDLMAVAVSPDDNVIASECTDDSQQRQLCLWSSSSGERLAVWPGPNRSKTDADPDMMHHAHFLPILDLAFSGNGSRLVSSSKDKTVKVWDVETGNALAVLEGHRESVTGVAIDFAGRVVASTGDDWTRLWSVDARLALDRFSDVEAHAQRLAFSSDETLLAVGGKDGVVRTFSLDRATLEKVATERVPFGLPPETCKRYGVSGCRRRASSAQLLDEARHLLRLHDDPRANLRLTAARAQSPRLDTDRELARFYGARLTANARHAIVDQIHQALNDWSKQPASANAKQDPFPVLAEAAKQAQSAGAARLEEARKYDAQASFDSSVLAARIARRSLFELASYFAEAGKPVGVERLMRMMHAQGDDLAARARRMTSSVLLTKAFEATLKGRADQALESLERVQLDDGDPRTVSWLWLASQVTAAIAERNRNAGASAIAERHQSIAIELCGKAISMVTDPDILVELAGLLSTLGTRAKAQHAVNRALELDPTNDDALFLKGLFQFEDGRHADAAATLREVSPLSPKYKQAIAFAGSMTYDQLKKLDEGYRLMVLAAEGRDASGWANLAEAAWATRRYVDASLIARRILEARDVDRSEPDTQLAMRFVLVASLAQMHRFDEARAELEELIAFAPRVSRQTWNYHGSRTAAKQLSVPSERELVVALVDYVESLGKKVSPKMLRDAFDKLAAGRRAP